MTRTNNQFIAAQCDQAGESVRLCDESAQPVLSDLKTLVKEVHSAKGRHHTQVAMCNLYDACGLSNVRPGAEVAQPVPPAVTQKRPINCGTGHCSCIECLFDTPKDES